MLLVANDDQVFSAERPALEFSDGDVVWPACSNLITVIRVVDYIQNRIVRRRPERIDVLILPMRDLNRVLRVHADRRDEVPAVRKHTLRDPTDMLRLKNIKRL